MPNFFRYKPSGPGKKEDGITNVQSHSITELNEEEAEQFGEMMKQSFIAHWKSKKATEQ